MKIATLLNPVVHRHDQLGLSDEAEEWTSTVTRVMDTNNQVNQVRTLRDSTRNTPTPTWPKSKGTKMAKDAPIFRKGPTKGVVRFPPHEPEVDSELAAEHAKFRIFPNGEAGSIADYCHRIPYSSDKKTFLTKTGREAFEVFQYTFKVPDGDKEYNVMWDYNIGLVRITPFFKSCRYTKTTPARALNANPGLRDITHSITGGALAAQGYWMPFEAAKALAANFTWSIRFALTPLFGEGFLSECLEPTDADFGNFKIDRAIIRACTAEQQSWLRRHDARHTPTIGTPAGSEVDADTEEDLSASPAASNAGSPIMMSKLRSPFTPWQGRLKQLRPKPPTAQSHTSAGPVGSQSRCTPDSESGCGTDTDAAYYSASDAGTGPGPREHTLWSPQVSPKTVLSDTSWTAINRASAGRRPPSPKERAAIAGLLHLAASASPSPTPANSPEHGYMSLATPSPTAGADARGLRLELSRAAEPRTPKRRFGIGADDGADERAGRVAGKRVKKAGGKRGKSRSRGEKTLRTTESRAAYCLMQLSGQNEDSVVRAVKRSRRAST